MNFLDLVKLIIGAAIATVVIAAMLQALIVAVLAAGVAAIATLVYFMFRKEPENESSHSHN